MTATTRLPKPTSESWQWQLRAACRDLRTSRFFHPDHERGERRAERERQAKAVCRRCPVMAQCREHALRAQEPYGVWGGLGEQERRALLGTRRRAAAA
ncbi:WhiB family transcriptional regulator [Saccharopolyspora flava]|uniref:Transcriptional regulator WhiB n=1 Tax=Saccharopolyspora flava TaxID=95161 RepID=A0A1I6U7P5_9PSEU|nr:WhiB family transcriptional regulator [Saccharopolyspora flava]SFS97569.1 WhiB family transcriptional regulator, redox-sensing transcriptional regulator [Saccharopolyspora flava]